MREDHWCANRVEDVGHHLLAHVANIDQHAQPIHLENLQVCVTEMCWDLLSGFLRLFLLTRVRPKALRPPMRYGSTDESAHGVAQVCVKVIYLGGDEV